MSVRSEQAAMYFKTFQNGDHLTDHEILLLHDHLNDVVNFLRGLGDKYYLATFPLRITLERVGDCIESRKRN